MSSKILDCKECKYEEDCPVWWHKHNAACLQLQKEKEEYQKPCCNNCIYYRWYYDKCILYNCSMDARSICSSWRGHNEEDNEEYQEQVEWDYRAHENPYS